MATGQRGDCAPLWRFSVRTTPQCDDRDGTGNAERGEILLLTRGAVEWTRLSPTVRRGARMNAPAVSERPPALSTMP